MRYGYIRVSSDKQTVENQRSLHPQGDTGRHVSALVLSPPALQPQHVEKVYPDLHHPCPACTQSNMNTC
ncbi:MAG: hypothetical protein IJ047_00850 [Paludibacteraceae bacterium]|nr:hypothetical protein [Paludibacteraceae bacterium]